VSKEIYKIFKYWLVGHPGELPEDPGTTRINVTLSSHVRYSDWFSLVTNYRVFVMMPVIFFQFTMPIFISSFTGQPLVWQ